MNLDNLTIGEAREISRVLTGTPTDNGPWEIGKAYFVRTVTNYLTGRLVSVGNQELVFSDAAWIPWTGRFNEALTSGSFAEVEPFPAGRVIVGRGSIVDAIVWGISLPRSAR